jgi:hypothetical protein
MASDPTLTLKAVSEIANERQRVSHASGVGHRGPRERPPTLFELRRGLAVALRAKAEACKGVRGTKSPG